MIISGHSEVLDFGTYPVFSRKISASTTQSRESVFLIFSFLETKKISSHFIFFSFFLFLSFFFLPPNSPKYLLQKYLFQNIFSTSPSPPHQLPHTSIPPHPLPWQATIGQEKHLTLHFTNKPLLFIYLRLLHKFQNL